MFTNNNRASSTNTPASGWSGRKPPNREAGADNNARQTHSFTNLSSCHALWRQRYRLEVCDLYRASWLQHSLYAQPPRYALSLRDLGMPHFACGFSGFLQLCTYWTAPILVTTSACRALKDITATSRAAHRQKTASLAPY